MTPMLELHNIDVPAFLKVLDQCVGNVYLVTRDGDHLNLKSKLCQLVGLKMCIRDRQRVPLLFYFPCFLTFHLHGAYNEVGRTLFSRYRRCFMKKSNTFKFIICVISAVAAISAATAFFIYKEKKRKDEEELEHYLDSVIQ